MLNRSRFGFLPIFIFLLFLSALVLSVTGCDLQSVVGGTDGPASTSGSAGTPKKTQRTTTVVTTTAAPTIFDPLTGLPADSDKFDRPISVCIGNTPGALPHRGIENADILVEAQVEGGITRLMAIISDYKTLGAVGSIRSTRDYLMDFSNDFGAIALYAGTSDVGSGSAIKNGDTLDYIHQDLGSVFYRDNSLSAPHDLMTDGQRITSGISELGYETGLSDNFSAPLAFGKYGSRVSFDKSATDIYIGYSSVQNSSFSYVPGRGVYQKVTPTAASGDDSSANPEFTNIIILFCNATIHETGVNSSELSLDSASGGRGLCLTDGSFAEIKWSRDQKSGTLQLTLADGSPLEVNRGRTYIGLMRASLEGNVKIG